MRYLGNKESIVSQIEALLEAKGLTDKHFIFFDAFCGSGSVADAFKDRFHMIINDNLLWSVIYTKGRLCAPQCTFQALGFDPFEYFNHNTETRQGFLYNHYSPGNSERMYFTAENAGRIDYFRYQIEEWKRCSFLSEEEYCYLLSCLIESVSNVSNTAGVYGAFLKKWDSRAIKPILFDTVNFKNAKNLSLTLYHDKIETIIEAIDCDILYLDPPYTQNQYGTQYHLLETLILNDEPSISPVTGSRTTAPMRSDWSKKYKCHILFDYLLAKTTARYIVFSYNNDGFMSKEFIEACMKRYGKPDSYVCQKISYKKYQNWKSANEKKHFEYLFFIEKKHTDDIIYESPLNYIGSKFRIAAQIKQYLPAPIHTFVDAFGGGFNVGSNVSAAKVLYNDLNYFVKDLIDSFYHYDTYQYILYVKKQIRKFGLEKNKADAYYKARDYYNCLPVKKRDPRFLFVLLMYGYQQQIRFNAKHEFNNPVGMRWFNDNVLEKLISFSRHIKEGNYQFKCMDYLELFHSILLTSETFVYFDPPYQLTTGTYNDGKRGFKGWDKQLEQELFQVADRLTANGVPFMLSYVLEHNGVKNKTLKQWIDRNGYTLIELGEILGISGSRRKEILVINYVL